MKATCFFLCVTLLPTALAAAPVPLVTGVVRNQAGAAIAGARVSIRRTDGTNVPAETTLTDGDGTFALPAADRSTIAGVTIQCRFCTTKDVGVGEDGTVVAVVQQYLALTHVVPSADDLANLPYGHVQSSLALTPFQVLENSSSLVPGPTLSDRGIQSVGGLVIDAGIPDYDFVSGISPFYAEPQQYIQSVSVLPQSDAFRYGDIANGGTYELDPQSLNDDALASGGGNETLRFGASSAHTSFSAGLSDNAQGQQRRFDASVTEPIDGLTTNVTVTASDASLASGIYNALDTGFSAVHASVEQVRALDVRADLYAERASYTALFGDVPLDETWSDAGATVTIAQPAKDQMATETIAPCATFGVRTSSGTYYADTYSGASSLSGVITQGQSVIGFTGQGNGYRFTAGFGLYAVGYSGGSFGASEPAVANATNPVVRVQLTPSDRWSLEASFGGGFMLPLLLEQYGGTPPYGTTPPGLTALPATNLLFDRVATLEGDLEYTDTSRLRFGVTALSRYSTGIDQGKISSAGATVAWQVTPTISLRTWWLRVTPDLAVTEPVFRFGVPPQEANVGSAWLSYQTRSALRLDVIWNQDLTNDLPDTHLDASVSAPLARNLRWFVGTERYQGVRSLNAGIRFAPS